MSRADRKDSRDPETPRYRRGSRRDRRRCGGRCDLGCISAAASLRLPCSRSCSDVPLPQAPAPDLQGPLLPTLTGARRAAARSPAVRPSYIQGGLGRIEGIAADRAYNNAAAKGYFPLSFTVADIDQDGAEATANVTATVGHRRSRHPDHPVHRRPEPHRLADLDASRRRCRLSCSCGRLSRPDRMHRTVLAVLSAATIVAALGLSGCSDDTTRRHRADSPPHRRQPPAVAAAPRPRGRRCRHRSALTDVMSRLADPGDPRRPTSSRLVEARHARRRCDDWTGSAPRCATAVSRR